MNTASLNAPIGNASTTFNSEEAASHSSVGATGYNYGYLDEQTKRMIRRALLKAVSIPGYQVPFGGREMPMPYGWGTGGVQITAAIIGQPDTLKVIDQGADDTTNAVSIREFFKSIASAKTTEKTTEASIIQTRHRIPEVVSYTHLTLPTTPLMLYRFESSSNPLPVQIRLRKPRKRASSRLDTVSQKSIFKKIRS